MPAENVHRTLAFRSSNSVGGQKNPNHNVVGVFWQRMRDSNPIKKSSFPLRFNRFLIAVAIFIAIFDFWGSAKMGSKCVLIAVFIPL